MKALLITFFLVGTIVQIQAQKYKAKRANYLFQQGVNEFNNGNFKIADSLFIESNNNKLSVDSYFNRALCQKELGNFIEYCEILGFTAKSLGDSIAQNQYNSDCIRTNTYYVDSNQKTVPIDSAIYIIKITFLKYKNSQSLLQLNNDGTINFGYNIENFDTTYFSLPDSIMNPLIVEVQNKVTKAMTIAKKDPNFPNYTDSFFYINFKISKNGTIEDVDCSSVFNINPDLNIVIKTSMESQEPIKPVMLNGKPIQIRLSQPIDFNIN